MTAQAPPASREAEAPSSDPRAVALSGLRRGVVQVFLPLALAGQALAWFLFAVSHAYHPWSWFKIGFAYVLSASRVRFNLGMLDTSGPTATLVTERLIVAFGAFTVLSIVLVFRAGSDQGRLFARRPGAAALAGAVVGAGFALPCFVASLLVRLSFPAQGITSLRPVEWEAFVLPLTLGVLVGAIGGADAASQGLDRRTWGARLVSAGHGGWTALAWGIVLAFVGFLLLAALQPKATEGYARAMRDRGRLGAVLVTHHALLLPNQSTMILATSMGAPTELSIGDEEVARLTIDGVQPIANVAFLLAALIGGEGGIEFPWWYHAFWLVPAAAAILGGRRAATGVGDRSDALVRGIFAGVVYAALCGAAAWAATLVVPLPTSVPLGASRLGPAPWFTAAVALPWGVVGAVIGSLLTFGADRRRQDPEGLDDPLWPRPTSA